MNPPVDAPASRQRRPATRSAGKAASAPASFGRRGTRSPAPRGLLVTVIGASWPTWVAGLPAAWPATSDPPGGDQLGGLLTGPGQPSPDQFGVQPSPRAHPAAAPVSCPAGSPGLDPLAAGPLACRVQRAERGGEPPCTARTPPGARSTGSPARSASLASASSTAASPVAPAGAPAQAAAPGSFSVTALLSPAPRPAAGTVPEERYRPESPGRVSRRPRHGRVGNPTGAASCTMGTSWEAR